MNDTGGGVTAIHDVPGDITRIGFHWMLFFPFCHSKGASICSSHGVSRRSRIFFVPNLRIIELFLHTDCRGIIFFITNYRIIEYLSHGMSRFFFPRFVLGPTDQREVIAEFLSITRRIADGYGACSSCEWGLFIVVYRPIWGVCV